MPRILDDETYEYLIFPTECIKVFFEDHRVLDGHCLSLVIRSIFTYHSQDPLETDWDTNRDIFDSLQSSSDHQDLRQQECLWALPIGRALGSAPGHLQNSLQSPFEE
jgi:hypothetical protein